MTRLKLRTGFVVTGLAAALLAGVPAAALLSAQPDASVVQGISDHDGGIGGHTGGIGGGIGGGDSANADNGNHTSTGGGLTNNPHL